VTTVLIADDDHLMRVGLAAVLESDDQIEVIGQASTGREAIALTRRRDPDVVLMAVQMPDLGGSRSCAHLIAPVYGGIVSVLRHRLS
jgi:DNA-binding NarL/FixJ family response regulator